MPEIKGDWGKEPADDEAKDKVSPDSSQAPLSKHKMTEAGLAAVQGKAPTEEKKEDSQKEKSG